MQLVIKIVLSFVIFTLLITGCESKGDSFEKFNVRETHLGNVLNHSIRKAFFISGQKGYIAISPDTILKTDNGCRSFTTILAKPYENFDVISFINDSIGFVAGKNNQLYKTINSGISWYKVDLDIPEKNLTDIKFLNADTIFISANSSDSTKGGFILRSADGGQHWESIATIDLSKLCFFNKLIGFACGNDGILKTTDGGKSWIVISMQSANEIVFITADTGYSISHRSLYRTNDGGTTWTLLKTIVNRHWVMGEDNSRIECLNVINKKDLIFTLNSRIIKVTEDGRRWFQYEFTRPYYQLQMISSNTGMLYGYENLILITF